MGMLTVDDMQMDQSFASVLGARRGHDDVTLHGDSDASSDCERLSNAFENLRRKGMVVQMMRSASGPFDVRESRVYVRAGKGRFSDEQDLPLTAGTLMQKLEIAVSLPGRHRQVEPCEELTEVRSTVQRELRAQRLDARLGHKRVGTLIVHPTARSESSLTGRALARWGIRDPVA